jgi:mannitol-specific phosphotransferase system IIBC component
MKARTMAIKIHQLKNSTMNNNLTDINTRTGTAGGTLLVLFMQISSTQLLNTAITAATGAVVSFIVAVTCKYLLTLLTGNRHRKPARESKQRRFIK